MLDNAKQTIVLYLPFQGGKKKKKKLAEEDKREFKLNHHDHGDKHFHDKAHPPMNY